MSASGYGAVDKVSKSGDTMTGTLILSAATPLQVTTGSPAAGKLLTSDVSGNASWTAGAWTDWSSSFAITASTTNPTLGNSTITARYTQIGKAVLISSFLTIGSTFSAGSGNYSLALPLPARTPVAGAGAVLVFKSGVQLYAGAIVPTDATHGQIYLHAAVNALGSSGPSGSGWASGDYIRFSLTYETT